MTSFAKSSHAKGWSHWNLKEKAREANQSVVSATED